MAKTYTRAELRTRVRQLTDTENDQHLSDPELDNIIDSALSETYDLICDSGLGEKYVKSNTFNSVADQLEYPISTALGTDFYRLTDLYVVENTNQLRKLQRVQPSEILGFKPPQTVVQLKGYYIPFLAKKTADGDTFDGLNGWEEHALMVACCAVKIKRDESYGQYKARKTELEQRIRHLGNVDFGEPPRVARKRGTGVWNRGNPWYYYQNNVNAYGIRGDKIELYYLNGYVPT